MPRRSAILVTALFAVGLVSATALAEGLPPELDWADGYSNAQSSGAAVASDGSVIVTGTFSGTVDFDPGPGTENVSVTSSAAFILKLDASGDLVWVETLDGPDSADTAWGQDVALDATGNIYVSGTFRGSVDFNPGGGPTVLTMQGTNTDSFVAKYAPSGSLIWARSWGDSGIRDVNARGVAVDTDGNVIVSGGFRGEVDFDPGPGETLLSTPTPGFDVYVLKFAPNGDFVWAKDAGGDASDTGHDVAVDPMGNVYAIGYFAGTVDFDPDPVDVSEIESNAGIGDNDAFVWKLDANGDYEWAHAYGSQYDDDDGDWGIQTDEAGNVYASAHLADVVDFDPGPGEVLAGQPGSTRRVHVWKLDTDGGILWAHATEDDGISGYAENHAIGLDSFGVYVTGRMFEQVDFLPGPGTHYLTSGDGGGRAAFIWKLSLDGDFVWARNFGSDTNDVGLANVGFAVATDGAGGVYSTGQFGDETDFDPGPGVSLLYTSGGFGDMFVSKLLDVDLDGDGIDNSTDPDIDGDGIANGVDPDDYDNRNATFDDEAGTYGTLTDRSDLDLAVTGPIGPSGVQITAGGGGTGTALVTSCDDDYVTNLTDGDDVVITCGSITVQVVSGPVEVTLGSGVTVAASTGATVEIDEVGGVLQVINQGTGGTVTVSVNGVPTDVPSGETWTPNEAPVCDAATPNVDTLWPPNRKFASVGILGVTDPDGDIAVITIVSIFQDEPTGGEADGVGVGSSNAQLRAEFAGTGNGRVYHVGFTADDGAGGSCSGEVLVSVPKNLGAEGAA
ncbi:MAG: hypothetical protein PVF87_13595, partial [Acidimicrobiia bacterium]